MMNITDLQYTFYFCCEFWFLEYKIYNFIAARKTRSETLRNLKRRTKGRVKLVRSRIFRDDGTQTCREESAVVIEAQKRKQYLLHTSVIPLLARKLWILKNASLLGEAIFSSFRRNHFFFTRKIYSLRILSDERLPKCFFDCCRKFCIILKIFFSSFYQIHSVWKLYIYIYYSLLLYMLYLYLELKIFIFAFPNQHVFLLLHKAMFMLITNMKNKFNNSLT